MSTHKLELLEVFKHVNHFKPWIKNKHIADFDEVLPARICATAYNACKVINPDNPLTVAETIPELVGVLKEISEGKGRYSQDPLTHASNAIDDMKALALQALAKLGGE